MALPRMGMFSVWVRVFSADRTTWEELQLVVDTGSVFTWIPSDVAQRLGILPTDIQRFRSIDRGGIQRPVGDAVVELEGRRGAVGVVFGQPGDALVLGVTALERLGFEVDPRTQRLRRLDEQAAFAMA